MAASRRKPLSDITNITLTPISDLQKLVAASSSSKLCYSSSTNQKSISQSSSKSNTSIGSSNVSVAKKTVQFRGLPPSIASSSGVIGSKDAAHNRRQITEKSKKEREADMIFIRTPVEKRNDKGKAIAVPPSSSLSEKTKDNQNGNKGILKHSQSSNAIIEETGQEYLNPSSFLVPRAKGSGKPLNIVNSHEKTREKGKAIAVPFTSSPYEKTKENQNCNEGILKHTRSSNLIIKETGQDFRNSSSFLVQRAKDSKKPLNTVNSNEKTKEKGKAIAVPLSSSPYEKIKDNQNGKERIVMYSRSPNLRIKETVQESLNPSSFSILNAKDSGKPSHEKSREKGKTILQPSDIIEVLEHKGSSTVAAVKSLLPRRQSEKRKFDAGASSCPPTMRPKSIENNLNEAGDFKSLKSCTDPHLKRRKKTCSRIKKTSEVAEDSNDKLPEAFVQQQKAYFKEVDDFELAEEEVSSDELD